MVSEDIGTYDPDEDEEVPGEVTRAQRQKAETARAKVVQAAADLAKQNIAPLSEQEREGYKVFVAPVEKNTQFLAVPGEMIKFRDPNSPTGYREYGREGDVWVKFTNGVLCTKDPAQIAWCEANPEVCRDANDPRTKAWAILKEGQVATASREATTDPRLNIDELIEGAGSAAESAARASKSGLIETAETQLREAAQ